MYKGPPATFGNEGGWELSYGSQAREKVVLNSVVGNAIEDGPEASGGWAGACVFPLRGGLAGPFPPLAGRLGGHAGAAAPFPSAVGL